ERAAIALGRGAWFEAEERSESSTAPDRGVGHDTVELSRLAAKTHALVRLGASLAIDATASSYQSNVEVAMATGATVDEIVGTLIAVAPTVDLTCAVPAAPSWRSPSATTSTRPSSRATTCSA